MTPPDSLPVCSLTQISNHSHKKRKQKKRPFGVNLVRSQVLYRDAQESFTYSRHMFYALHFAGGSSPVHADFPDPLPASGAQISQHWHV